MADVKISGLPASTTPVAGSEVLPIVQGGVTKKVSIDNLTAGKSVSGTSFVPTGSTVPTNGMFLGAANSVSIATNSVERWMINASGNLNPVGSFGIGTTLAPVTDVVSNKVSVGVAGTTKGTVTLSGNTSGTVTVQPAAAAGTWSLTLPTTAGTPNYVLQTDGSGVTSWVAQTPATPPGGSSTQIQYNTGSGFGGISTFTTDGTNVTLSGGALNLTGNQSVAAWTTNGIKLKGGGSTLTDTTSSGTVAAAYTNVLGGNTIAASNSTTYTDYSSVYISGPVAGTNVTFTNRWALNLMGGLTSSGQSLTGAQDQSLFNLATTWNTSGTPTAIKLNVTDTASNAASNLLDLQVGSASQFKVSKTGAITAFTVNLTGNQSLAAWTTSGAKLKGGGSTLTDTTSSGTVAAAYTNVLGGNTIAASNSTTFTDYVSTYVSDPVAGTNVTITNKWSFGTQGNIKSGGVVNSTGYQVNSSAIITESGTTRTLSATDNGKIIYCTSSSAITITTAASLGAGFSCTIIQGGTGQITVAQGSSTTLVSYGSFVKTAGQYAAISVVCPVADTFLLMGQTA